MDHDGTALRQAAAAVCLRFTPGESARALLGPGMTAGQFLGILVEKGEFPDAVRLLAHALPKREAVWWACLCARRVAGAELAEPVAAALGAAEAWVAEPDEENRRRAQPAAEAATLGVPAGCAAMAAFWSGGSLGPPNVPVVPPPDHLTPHGVAGAVMLAAVSTEPEKAPEKYRGFLSLGTEVANGQHPWPATGPRQEEPSAASAATAARPPAAAAAKRPTISWD